MSNNNNYQNIKKNCSTYSKIVIEKIGVLKETIQCLLFHKDHRKIPDDNLLKISLTKEDYLKDSTKDPHLKMIDIEMTKIEIWDMTPPNSPNSDIDFNTIYGDI